MPVRILVRGFQSIEDAEVLVDRFTVVTGPNNSGKTALQRAVQGTFSNAPGDSFVRHGAERLSVEIDFGDGASVRWEKGPKVKPTYVVGGKTLHPGRAVPDEVVALGVQPIQVGAMSVWPQIAPQFTGQVFLLDMPGSAVAEAVADVERVGKLTQALRLADSDKRAATSELKVRRKDVEQVRSALGEFSGLDAVETVVASIEVTLAEAEGVSADVASADALRVSLREAETDIARHAGIREVEIPPLEAVMGAQNVGTDLVAAVSLRERLQAARQGVDALVGIRDIVVPPDPTEATTLRGQLRDLCDLRVRVTAATGGANCARDAAVAVRSVDLSAEVTREASALQARKALAFFVDVRDRMRKAGEDVGSLNGELERTRIAAEGASSEVHVLLGNIGSCPVCGTISAGIHPH
jgi:exonuclease SbcC